MRHAWKLIISLVLLAVLLLLVSTFALASTQQKTTNSNTTVNNMHQISDAMLQTSGGDIGKSITTQENVELTLLAVEANSTQIFVHFQVHNYQTTTTDLTTNGVIHRFYASLGLKEVALSPTANDIKHPSLPISLGANEQTDGWVTADTTSLGGNANVILYKIAPFHTTACKSKTDKSTCKPATLYYGVEWVIQDGLQ